MIINVVDELKGTISTQKPLTGTIQQEKGLKGVIDASSDNISFGYLKAIIFNSTFLSGKVNFTNELKGAISTLESVDSYDGDYLITPRIKSQFLFTKNKKMNDDITVLAIPYYETSNLSGKTVYIGGE